jgi:hypothetical protein
MDLQELLELARQAEADGRTADRDRLMDMYFAEEQSAKPSTTEDVVKAGASGGLGGFSSALDLMGQGATLIQEGPSMLSRMLFGGMEDAPEMNLDPQILPLASKLTGGFTEYEPQTTAGEYAKTTGQFVGGAMAMPYGGPLNAARSAILPALASETAGQMTEGTEMEGPARLAAALGTPFATSAMRQGMQRAVLGPEARLTQPGSERAASVSTLEQADVPMTTGLKAGSQRLMALEGSMEPPLATKAGLTSAVMRSMGSDSPLATPKALSETKKRLGDVFDAAEDMVDDVPSLDVGLAAEKVITDHMNFSGTGTTVPKLRMVSDQIVDATTNQVPLSGKKLQNMRSDLRRIMNEAGPDDQSTFQAAFQLNSVIDDFLIESIRQTQPKFVPELMKAREEYRNFLTTMRAKKVRGSDSAGGYISPAMLSGALRTREGDSYILGTGSELADLGRAAEEVISSMPAVQAGGARRISGGGGLLGLTGGGYAGMQYGMDPITAGLAGAAAGAAIPSAGRAAIRSGPAQRALMPTQNSAATQMLLDTLRSGARQTGGLLNIPQ